MKSTQSILQWIQMHFVKTPKKLLPAKAFFVWIPSLYSVHIACFDEEYKRIGELLNKIHYSLTHKRDGVEAVRLMEHLLSEALQHFSKEEEALKNVDYPELEEHIAEHRLVLNEIENLLHRFKTGSVSGQVVISFIKHWIIGHIVDSDQKYSKLLRRNGLR